MHSAWSNIGSGHKAKKFKGFDALIKTDFASDKVGLQTSTDFGRKTSNLSYHNFLDGFNNPYYSVGADGEYVQWIFDGDSDTDSSDGFELYSVGAVVQK